jgi:hypothetical protein
VLGDVQGIETTETASLGAHNSATNVLDAYLYLNFLSHSPLCNDHHNIVRWGCMKYPRLKFSREGL